MSENFDAERFAKGIASYLLSIRDIVEPEFVRSLIRAWSQVDSMDEIIIVPPKALMAKGGPNIIDGVLADNPGSFKLTEIE